MKRFTEYSNTELAALDEVGIQRLIDIELAVDGVIPVPQPQKFSMQEAKLQKSEQVFKVGSLLFKNQEDANQVAQMELLETGYEYSGAGYTYQWLKPMTGSVEAVSFYKEDEVRAASQQLREFNKRKDEYEKEEAVWNKYQSQVGSISEEVWAAVRQAQAEMFRIDTAFQTLQKYKDLADGDEAVAVNFFKNTYKHQPDLIEAVLDPQPQEIAVEEALEDIYPLPKMENQP